MMAVIDMTHTVKDPVCGMEISPQNAVATEQHDGATFYFCSRGCHEAFRKDPHRYGHPAPDHGAHEH
jgi:Cu+-exporting ATPase